MCLRLIPFPRAAKRVWRRNETVGRSEKAKKTPKSFFMIFHGENSIKLIVLFFSESAFAVPHTTIEALNPIKDSLYCREGKLESFHLCTVKIFQLFSSLIEHTPPMRWETDHSKSSIQTGRCASLHTGCTSAQAHRFTGRMQSDAGGGRKIQLLENETLKRSTL